MQLVCSAVADEAEEGVPLGAVLTTLGRAGGTGGDVAAEHALRSTATANGKSFMPAKLRWLNSHSGILHGRARVLEPMKQRLVPGAAALAFLAALGPLLCWTRGHRTLLSTFPAHADVLVLALAAVLLGDATLTALARSLRGWAVCWISTVLAIQALAFLAGDLGDGLNRDWRLTGIELAAVAVVACASTLPLVFRGDSARRAAMAALAGGSLPARAASS